MTEQRSEYPHRVAFFLYGAASYVLFLGAFVYAIGFVCNLIVPKTLDSGVAGSMTEAIIVNTLLVALFGIQHSVMARPGFKRWWTGFVPEVIERSTYVLLTNLLLFLMFWQWRPMPELVWSIEQPIARAALYGLGAGGWLLVLYATFLIDHFDLFGLRQVYLYLRGRPYTHPPFATPTLYRLIRNPIMLGWFIAFWATPVMTQSHLLFAIAITIAGLVGILFEERDLLQILGEPYRRYRQRTPMLLPIPRRGSPAGDDGSTGDSRASAV